MGDWGIDLRERIIGMSCVGNGSVGEVRRAERNARMSKVLGRWKHLKNPLSRRYAYGVRREARKLGQVEVQAHKTPNAWEAGAPRNAAETK